MNILKLYKSKKWVKILINTLIVLTILMIATIIFINLWLPFGGRADDDDKKEYAKRAENYYDGCFNNEGEFTLMKNDSGEKTTFLSSKGTKPEDEIKTVKPTYQKKPSISEFNVTWFGHSTILIQMHGMNILIDPVFSDYSSPVQMLFYKRFSNPPITMEELPHIDIAIITHDHYDHLDYNTIKKIDDKVDRYIVPLGVENHLERWGVDSDKIKNMAWWEETKINGLTICCTPGKHFSNRFLTDRAQTLWASWVLKDENYQIFESGDTGYGDHFSEIYERYGEFDFAMVDSGQFNVRWPNIHMNPYDSYKAATDLHAKIVMPIHWGTFALSNHPWDESPTRMIDAAKDGDIPVVTPMIGETMSLDKYEDYMNRWWKEIE